MQRLNHRSLWRSLPEQSGNGLVAISQRGTIDQHARTNGIREDTGLDHSIKTLNGTCSSPRVHGQHNGQVIHPERLRSNQTITGRSKENMVEMQARERMDQEGIMDTNSSQQGSMGPLKQRSKGVWKSY